VRAFKKALGDGHNAERQWVESIRDGGRSAAHGRKLVVRVHDKNKDHVETPDALGLVSIEIKERSLKFTSPGDYPYDTVYVDDMRGLGRERLQHLAYVYLSKPTGCWVWLTTLDRDSSWKEQDVFDHGQGHSFSMLVAPRKFLRPAEQLTDLLYPHSHLDLVDGDCGMFVSGGGETEERERYVALALMDFGGRPIAAPSQARQCLG
jgi:hypothetical protein